MENDNMSWLISCPSSDDNFRSHLKTATAEEIKQVLNALKTKGEKGSVSKISALSRELRRRKDA